MARPAYRKARRAQADAAYAALTAAPATPAPLPTLLALAAAVVDAHQSLADWTQDRTVEDHGAFFYMCRHNSLILLLSPAGGPGFPVGQVVGGAFRSMTDVVGFKLWLRMQGVA